MAAKSQVQNFLTLTYVRVLFLLQVFVGINNINIVSATEFCKRIGLNNCICTEDYVKCENERNLNLTGGFIHAIQDNVTKITITGSELTELPRNIFGSCKHTTELRLSFLRTVDLSDNKIKSMHGQTFHCMQNLTDLILRNNEWQLGKHPSHVGFFTSLPWLKRLDLTNAFQEVWNGTYHVPHLVHVLNSTELTRLETLSLSQNEFCAFSPDAAASLCRLTSLKTLNLSNNCLEKPSLKDCMKNLVTLDLSHNNMPIVHEDLRHVIDSLPNLKDVRLDHNMFACDCGLVETYRWLQQTNAPIRKTELRCRTGYHSSYINKTVLSLKESDLKCIIIPTASSKAATVVLSLIFAAVACAIIAFMVINRKKLKYFVGNWKKKTPRFSLRPHAGYSSVREVATVENL